MRLSLLTLGTLALLLVTVISFTESKRDPKNTADAIVGTDDRFLDGRPNYHKNVAHASVGTDSGSLSGRPMCGRKHGKSKGKGKECNDDKKKKKRRKEKKKKRGKKKYKKDKSLMFEDTNYAALL